VSRNERKELIQKIEQAFSDAQYPEDEAIVPLYDGLPHCDECATLVDCFRGKPWKAVPLETLVKERGSLPLFTMLAFRYYLPAYLIAGLLHPRETDTLRDNIFYSLTPPKQEVGPEIAHFRELLEGFSPEQRTLLKEFMRLYLQAEVSYKTPEQRRARKFWGLAAV
jgi:hypothetical protein